MCIVALDNIKFSPSSNVHICTQTTSNKVFLLSYDLNTLMCIVALNNMKLDPFQFKWFQNSQLWTFELKQPQIMSSYSQMCTFTLKSLKSYSLQHTQPTQTTTQMHQICIQALQTGRSTLVHLQCSKPPSINWRPNRAPMHLQHEAPQKFLQALKPLKIHSLTNKQSNF